MNATHKDACIITRQQEKKSGSQGFSKEGRTKVVHHQLGTRCHAAEPIWGSEIARAVAIVRIIARRTVIRRAHKSMEGTALVCAVGVHIVECNGIRVLRVSSHR